MQICSSLFFANEGHKYESGKKYVPVRINIFEYFLSFFIKQGEGESISNQYAESILPFANWGG